jgi:hypothetical protein
LTCSATVPACAGPPMCGPLVIVTSENRLGSSPHPALIHSRYRYPPFKEPGHFDHCSAKVFRSFSLLPFPPPVLHDVLSPPPPRPSLNPPSIERPTSGQIHFCVVLKKDSDTSFVDSNGDRKTAPVRERYFRSGCCCAFGSSPSTQPGGRLQIHTKELHGLRLISASALDVPFRIS